MSYSVKITPSAKKDLALAKEFYSKSNEQLGSYCISSLLLDIKRLSFYAGIHSKQHGYYRMLSQSFPFSIYYEIKDDKAVVIAVLDNRSNPSKLIKKLLAR